MQKFMGMLKESKKPRKLQWGELDVNTIRSAITMLKDKKLVSGVAVKDSEARKFLYIVDDKGELLGIDKR